VDIEKLERWAYLYVMHYEEKDVPLMQRIEQRVKDQGIQWEFFLELVKKEMESKYN